MDFMICQQGFRKPKDNRVYCKLDGGPCAHVYMCQLNCRWQHTNQAAECLKPEQMKEQPQETTEKAKTSRKGKK